jgi:hypothetical protein
LLILTAAAAGCGLPPSRIEFVEKLAQDNRKIARSTRAFRDAVLPLKDGKPANAGQVRTAYDAMKTAVTEVQNDAAGQMLPPSSNSAKAFLQAYKDYLAEEQRILDGPMKQIVDAVGRPSAAGDIWGQNGLLAVVVQQDSAAFSKVSQAQQEYANEHNYQTMPLRDYIENEKSGK